MESRLDRLTRAAEIAETAQKQLLVVEARLYPASRLASHIDIFRSAICMLETTCSISKFRRVRIWRTSEVTKRVRIWRTLWPYGSFPAMLAIL